MSASVRRSLAAILLAVIVVLLGILVAAEPSTAVGRIAAAATTFEHNYDPAPQHASARNSQEVAGTGESAYTRRGAGGSSSGPSLGTESGVAADSGVDATTVVGRRGSPLKVSRGTNEPAVIGGRSYGGHALDEMQSEGFTSSVVDDAITNGQATVGSSGRVGYYSPANNITVVTESDGKIVTVTSGTLKIR